MVQKMIPGNVVAGLSSEMGTEDARRGMAVSQLLPL